MSKSTLVALSALAALAGAWALAPGAAAEDGHVHDAASVPQFRRWDPDAVRIFEALPVQDGGRVKPLSTMAGFTLLALNGSRTARTDGGERLTPTEWLMDCVFFPERAVHYPVFILQTSEVLDAVGVGHEGKQKRDRYAYADLAQARDRIFDLASQYDRIEEKQRNAVQGQLVNLAHNMMRFESVAGFLDYARHPLTASISPGVREVFGEGASPGLADLIERGEDVSRAVRGVGDPHGADGEADPALRGFLEAALSGSRGLALLPPPGDAASAPEWLAPSDLVSRALLRGEAMPEQVAALRDLEGMARSRDDAGEFRRRAEAFRDRVTGLADARGEYAKIRAEVTFYKANLFFYSQWLFVVSFVLVAFTWMWTGAKSLRRSAVVAAATATALLAAGITMRCYIRGRPPVTTLYESVLFTTAVAVFAGLVTELINRRNIALSLSTLLGAAGVFLANKYEVKEAVDTMPSLVAVLDTNFWLATHVTTITIGYGAGLIAGAVGHVYVFGRILGARKHDPGFYKSLGTMTYGLLAFSLLFSVVGTVLGGIWANESWGRFWGWDPKENGALMIVLWQLVALHARLGGYVREFGLAMASIFGAAVVATSWWGVNLLGVGLHSYGFTSGVLLVLLIYYAFEAAVLLAGGVHWMVSRQAAAGPAPGGTR